MDHSDNRVEYTIRLADTGGASNRVRVAHVCRAADII